VERGGVTREMEGGDSSPNSKEGARGDGRRIQEGYNHADAI